MSLSAVMVTSVGAGVTFVANSEAHRDPFPSLLAAGILLWIVVGVDAVVPKLGTAIAVSYLLVSLLDHGTEFAGVVGSAASSKGASK